MIDPELKDDGAHGETSDRTVRQFAALCGLMLGLAATRDVWVRGAVVRGEWLAAVAAIITIAGLARPRAIRPLFVAALAITRPIGLVVSRLLLGIMFYAIFTPLAFMFRLSGRDALHRRRQDGARTYWVVKGMPSDVRSYFKQS